MVLLKLLLGPDQQVQEVLKPRIFLKLNPLHKVPKRMEMRQLQKAEFLLEVVEDNVQV